MEKEMDQMKKAMEEINDSMRRTHHMDDLIHRTDSPFKASVTNHPLPLKFMMPTPDSYDGMRDPYCRHRILCTLDLHARPRKFKKCYLFLWDRKNI